MTPTLDFLHTAEKSIRAALLELRPELLAAHGAIEHQHKEDKSVVTDLDVKVEQRLQEVCRTLDPRIAFSGEETGVDYEQKTFWLVDPIDGTESFIRGLPFSTNMIALIDNGKPVMGIIYNFFQDEYYLAIDGQGATKNGHDIHVSNRSFERAYVALAVGSAVPAEFAPELRKRIAGLPKLHASGAEASMVARGSFDGTVAVGAKGAWDHAAAAILMREAGARVENLHKKDYNYRDMRYVAANPLIFDELKKFTEAYL
jgi:fructose-1,6-bisphosphatase/inositol monophosphatase family enzyme